VRTIKRKQSSTILIWVRNFTSFIVDLTRQSEVYKVTLKIGRVRRAKRHLNSHAEHESRGGAGNLLPKRSQDDCGEW